jgi:hypothetical protein
MKFCRKTLFMSAATAFLIVMGTAYLVNGLQHITAREFAGDLLNQWHTQRYVSNGINPYDVGILFLKLELTPSEEERIKHLNAIHLQEIMPVVYPPWAYVTNMLLLVPDNFRVTQFIFATLSVAALGLVSIWAFSVGKSHSRMAGLILSASVFAMSANASTLRLGQYGLICNALLVVMLWSETRTKQIPEGIAFALAALKPSFSGFYFVVFLIRRHFVAMALVLVYVVMASLVVGYLVRTSPIEMILQMFVQSSLIPIGGVGPLNVLLEHGALAGPTNAAAGAAGLVAVVLLMIRFRDTSTLTLFSIAAVIGRLFFYHRQYDNVMLVFPLVALGLGMFEKPSALRIGIFLIFGCSLWFPLRYSDYTDLVQLIFGAIWIGGLCAVLAYSSSSKTLGVTKQPARQIG